MGGGSSKESGCDKDDKEYGCTKCDTYEKYTNCGKKDEDFFNEKEREYHDKENTKD